MLHVHFASYVHTVHTYVHAHTPNIQHATKPSALMPTFVCTSGRVNTKTSRLWALFLYIHA